MKVIVVHDDDDSTTYLSLDEMKALIDKIGMIISEIDIQFALTQTRYNEQHWVFRQSTPPTAEQADDEVM